MVSQCVVASRDVCVDPGIKMIALGIYFLLLNVRFMEAHPSAMPQPLTELTTPGIARRLQLVVTTALNCSACKDVVDLIVCGTDGKTYINECRFKCAKLENTELDVKHPSVCEKDREGCLCTNDSHSQICGSDGKTYETKCVMWCENWVSDYGSTVQVKHDGPCKETYTVDDSKPAHYKDTATRYNHTSTRYNDAATRYNDAATLFNAAAARYIEQSSHFSDAKTRHNYPKTREDAIQKIHEATLLIAQATDHIDEATRHINEATRHIDEASLDIDE